MLIGEARKKIKIIADRVDSPLNVFSKRFSENIQLPFLISE